MPWTIDPDAPATPIRVLVVQDDRVIRDVFLDPDLANSESSRIMEAIRSATNGDGAPVAGAVRLTKREQEIKALIAAGLGNKEIAQRLNIATNTVKSHVHNMLGKLAALAPADGWWLDHRGRPGTKRRSNRLIR